MLRMTQKLITLLAAVLLLLMIIAMTVDGTNAVVANSTRNKPANITDVPVLNYHKIDVLNHALSVSPSDFDEQMAYLYEHGYHTITPDQLIAYLSYGKPLPDKPIMITFDDGYLDNYTNAYPILKKYNFTALIFIITNMIGKDPRFMTWNQVREMQQGGIVFGSHTANHAELTKLTSEQIMNELTQSRQEMKQQLGRAPKYLAYPTGAYSLQIEELVKLAGYKAAFTVRYGQVGTGSDPYALERIPIFRGQKTFRSFFIRLNGAPIIERLGLIRN